MKRWKDTQTLCVRFVVPAQVVRKIFQVIGSNVFHIRVTKVFGHDFNGGQVCPGGERAEVVRDARDPVAL